MDRGYLHLWRKSVDSRVFKNSELWHLWCYCLMKASYCERWVTIQTGSGDTEVKTEKGQFIYGSKRVARKLGQKWQTTHKRMKKLENLGKLKMESKTHFSIITICNWESYQGNGFAKENPEEKAGKKQVKTKGKAGKTNNTLKHSNHLKHSKENINIPFSFFYEAGLIKVDPKKSEKIWNGLTDEVRVKIKEHLPRYIKSNPDRNFLKRTNTYLTGECWLNEVVQFGVKVNNTKSNMVNDWFNEGEEKEIFREVEQC